jgi:hypothetical protein
MQRDDRSEETYYAISDPCSDELVGQFVVVSDAEVEDRPVGVAVAVGTLATSHAEVPLFYLVIHGRELPGMWARRGRDFLRGKPRPAGEGPDGYREIRRMIAASSAR